VLQQRLRRGALADRGAPGSPGSCALWAAELGLGVLEALDVALPKPSTLSRTVRRLVASLERRRKRSRPVE
jgi:hypothetical protein